MINLRKFESFDRESKFQIDLQDDIISLIKDLVDETGLSINWDGGSFLIDDDVYTEDNDPTNYKNVLRIDIERKSQTTIGDSDDYRRSYLKITDEWRKDDVAITHLIDRIQSLSSELEVYHERNNAKERILVVFPEVF